MPSPPESGPRPLRDSTSWLRAQRLQTEHCFFVPVSKTSGARTRSRWKKHPKRRQLSSTSSLLDNKTEHECSQLNSLSLSYIL